MDQAIIGLPGKVPELDFAFYLAASGLVGQIEMSSPHAVGGNGRHEAIFSEAIGQTRLTDAGFADEEDLGIGVASCPELWGTIFANRWKLPHPHGFIFRSGDNSPAVRGYRYSPYNASVPFECGDALASIQVPYPNGVIARAGGSSPSIERYRYSVYRADMFFEYIDALASIQVPYPNGTIARAGGSKPSIGRYRYS